MNYWLTKPVTFLNFNLIRWPFNRDGFEWNLREWVVQQMSNLNVQWICETHEICGSTALWKVTLAGNIMCSLSGIIQNLIWHLGMGILYLHLVMHLVILLCITVCYKKIFAFYFSGFGWFCHCVDKRVWSILCIWNRSRLSWPSTGTPY